jgi:hypothetical protein
MYHIIVVLVAAYSGPGGDVVEKARVIAAPDRHNETLSDCRDAMRNNPRTRGAVAQALSDLQKFVASSTNPGDLLRESPRVRCAPVKDSTAEILTQEGLR